MPYNGNIFLFCTKESIFVNVFLCGQAAESFGARVIPPHATTRQEIQRLAKKPAKNGENGKRRRSVGVGPRRRPWWKISLGFSYRTVRGTRREKGIFGALRERQSPDWR
jgi:hypothetical protein